MAKQDVLYTKEDSIGIITLNRPEKMNALTHEMLHRLNSITEDIKKDDKVRAVILTGNGKGLSKACELVFSGDIIDAQEMLRIGLVSKVVPDAELMPTAREMAKKLTRGAPLAVQMAKQLMYRGLEQTMEAHQEAARYCFQLSNKTEDAQEGIISFFEKREPWKGK